MSSDINTEDEDGERVVQSVLSKVLKVKELLASKKTDKELLQALVDNLIVQSLAKAHTGIVEKKIIPTMLSAKGLFLQLVEQLNEVNDDSECKELSEILMKPLLLGVIECHDFVAQRNASKPDEPHGGQSSSNGSDTFDPQTTAVKAIRMVGMYKKSWEPLGITVVPENDQLRIARILRGSETERKGLLHVDDIILEVNGNPLKGDPDLLKDYLIKTTGSIIFKILPSYEENLPPKLLYVKCHMDYDPSKDNLIPCVEAGLSFKRGEILQVVEQTDTEWWQAQRVNNKGEPRGTAGLIPSQSFEEKRRVLKETRNQSLKDKKKPKKKKSLRRMYSVSRNSAFDRQDIAVYEEVTCIPPISRKVVVLLVRSQSIADEVCRQIESLQPEQYGIADKFEAFSEDSTLSSSSKISTKELPGDLPDSVRYKELRSARSIMSNGKTCLIVTSPQCLKVLRTSEFMPFVVYVKLKEQVEIDIEKDDLVFHMSGRDIERYYMQYIDSTIEHVSAPATANEIVEKMENLKKKYQWVPTGWVY